MTDQLAATCEAILAHPSVSLSAWDEINAPMVRQWCEVMGSRNARYLRNDEVPATMLHVWTMPGFGGVFPEGVAVDPLREASRRLSVLGFTGVMAVRIQQQYFRALRLGERLRREMSIESVSPVKRTAVGDGIFVTEIATVMSGEVKIGTTRITLLCFRPQDPAAKAVQPISVRSAPGADGLALDARFIVSAAIATRDYEDVHLDPERARARGMKDIYINILTTLGLVQRFIEAAHGADIGWDAIDLRLLAPAHPGDELRFASRSPSPGQPVEFAMQLREAPHARGIAVISG